MTSSAFSYHTVPHVILVSPCFCREMLEYLTHLETQTLPRPKKDVKEDWQRQKRLRLPVGTANANSVGFRVREGREAGKWGQDALCGRVAEVTDGNWVPDRFEISSIERRLRMVTDLEVHALAAALSVSLCWLLTGDADEPIVWAGGLSDHDALLPDDPR